MSVYVLNTKYFTLLTNFLLPRPPTGYCFDSRPIAQRTPIVAQLASALSPSIKQCLLVWFKIIYTFIMKHTITHTEALILYRLCLKLTFTKCN